MITFIHLIEFYESFHAAASDGCPSRSYASLTPVNPGLGKGLLLC